MAQTETPTRPPPRWRTGPLATWALLVPAMLVLHPYAGLVQDARIYIGRGLADRDPGGLGRDLLFSEDAQTGFSLLRPLMRALLGAAPPDRVSMALVGIGLLAWLAAAVALARRLAPDRVAAAVVLAVLALPADYGTGGTFGYAEAIATPRLFAEAAVLGGLAALLARRPLAGLALLVLAAGLHPLMALPGFALAALLVLGSARRVAPLAVGLAAALAAGLLAAACGLPLFDRLFVVMDPAWADVLRARSVNLFPTLWPADAFAPIACRAAAAILAGGLAGDRPGGTPGGVRALFWGGTGVALAGLVLSLLFGDRVMSVLVTQLQPWRALWLLGVLGNAGLMLSVVGLWRGDAGARLTLAALVGAWATQPEPGLAVALAGLALGLAALSAAGRLRAVSPRIAAWALGAALVFAGSAALVGAAAVVALLLPLGRAWTAVGPWPYVLASGVVGPPLVAAAAALALAPGGGPARRSRRFALGAGVVLAAALAALVWDSRNDERRVVDARGGAAALDDALPPGPGGLLWIGDDSETWFLARRPAFFNAVQGAPGLFSRGLALEWADRARLLLGLGFARPSDVSLAAGSGQGDAVRLTPEAVTRFCADPRRPAGLVAPGSQLAAAPPGTEARLWSPPVPFRHLAEADGGLAWRTTDVFTVVACAASGAVLPAPSP